MNQKKVITLIISTFCMVTIVVSQPYQLRLGTEPTDSFIYRITETTDFIIKTNRETEINNETKIVDYQFLITESNLKNEVITSKVTIKDILIEKKEDDDKYLYDSKLSKTVNSPLDRSYAKLLEHQFDVTFDIFGEMNLSQNYNSIFEENFSSADIFDNTDFDQLKIQVKEEFNTNTFEQTMRYFKYSYPFDSVNVGDTWMIVDTIYPNFGVLSTMTYTLKEIKNEIAYIDIKADLAKDPDSKGIDMDLMHLKFNLQGQQEGLVLLDLNTGWIRKMSLAQELTGKMTVFFIDPQGKILKIKLRGSTDYDLINY
ncbi:MAG: DUF6263 family protein [Saprospiraceae bacterium]